MPDEESVERSKCAVTDRCALTPGTQQRKERRQHDDACEERDNHPGPRNDAELRYTAIFGGRKRVEPGSRRRGGKRQRCADLCTGIVDRPMESACRMPTCAIRDAEL